MSIPMTHLIFEKEIDWLDKILSKKLGWKQFHEWSIREMVNKKGEHEFHFVLHPKEIKAKDKKKAYAIIKWIKQHKKFKIIHF